MTRILALLMLLTGVGMAQGCPVKFERVRAAESVRQVSGRWSRYYFELKWKNVSDKEIIGAKFEAFAYDAMRQPRTFAEWQTDQKTSPGQSHNTSWEDTGYVESRQVDGKYAGIRLVQVLFADGTTWKDDGSGQCEGKTPSVNW